MQLTSQLTEVKGVGPQLAAKLDRLGLSTVHDLLLYLPRRYEDYSTVQPIAKLKPGPVTIQARIHSIKGRYVRRGLHITEAIAGDETGSVRLIWFNQPYRASQTKHDLAYYITGQFELNYQKLAIMNPSVELVSDFPVNTARIIPIYRETKGLSSSQIRKLIKQVIPMVDQLPETLPDWLVDKLKLMPRALALRQVHFPDDAKQLQQARARLGFNEVFELSLASLINKYDLLNEQALSIPFREDLAKQFVKHLPFKLTDAQRRTVWQIYIDMQKTVPMNRLVEGDVGSGKTVVAAMAAVMAMAQGFQVAVMAPTELLARQHAATIHDLLVPLGYNKQVGLLVGSIGSTQKQQIYDHIANGKIRLVIGTHALIQEKVNMHSLGLAIIDEQHRFGVAQRHKLQAKAGHALHVLSMTATPIPRSLALTLYGELDISIIDTKPANRRPIITEICSPHSRTQLYDDIKSKLKQGQQMFVVCPLITDSAGLTARSASKVYEEYKNQTFKDWRVGLLHGKMKATAKAEAMEQFAKGELDILVATTVIEVGVNVPNASLMLIENADRFGLAQIHQLRGRVGRSHQQGYCYLMLSDAKAASRRLRAVAASSNGFELAELDLEIRGPGAIYGTLQHGALDLRVAKLTDVKLIATARQAAQQFINSGEDLLQYKELSARVDQLRAVTNLN